MRLVLPEEKRDGTKTLCLDAALTALNTNTGER
jgi:hypothetical protein